MIKHYESDDSIFIDDRYLVKGVPRRIFWKLVQAYLRDGWVDFTNREIRLDATLQLPDIKDKLRPDSFCCGADWKNFATF